MLRRKRLSRAHSIQPFRGQYYHGFSDTLSSGGIRFSDYPNTPPAGTTPHAQTAANFQKTLSDGTGYYTEGRVYTNYTAAHAVLRLKETGVFFVFGHGGDTNTGFRQFQTFWDSTTRQWSFIVQTSTARNKILQDFAARNEWYVPDVKVLDEEPSGVFSRILLAVFEGCRTSYYNTTWGSPVRGVVNRGARCAIGFNDMIYSNAFSTQGLGAEDWADWFWNQLCVFGKTVVEVVDDTRERYPLNSGLRSIRAEGNLRAGETRPGQFRLHPARYGNQ